MAHRLPLVAVVLAGCLDAREPPATTSPHPSPGSSLSTTPTEQLVALACDRFEWPIAAPEGGATLAVATGASGAAIFATPAGGGDVAAFVVDPKGDVMTPSIVTRTSGTYVAAGATFVGDQLVASAIDSAGDAFVDLVAPDLSATTPIAQLPAAYASKTPMLDVWGTPSAPTLAARELDVTTFDATFAAPQTTAIEATRQPIAVDAAQLAQDGVVAWSTTTDCHVDVLGARGAVTSESQPFPCPYVRAAADAASYTTVVVYETSVGVEFFGAWFANVQPFERTLAPGASAPRIAYDGVRFWVAYIDASGELVAGFVTSGGAPVVTGLGALPTRDSFELGIVGGEPWVFTADDAGFHGQRMCLGVAGAS